MISLIATVLNEGDSIHALLESLAAQTCPPDEIVLVDGGSTDDTVRQIERYADQLPLRVRVEAGCNISRGRNIAIQTAHGDIIAVTDAGVRLTPTWLEHLTQPLRDDPTCQVASGFFQADPHTVFEAAMGATVLPLRAEIDPATFLPSSRSVAFRKSAWEAVGGYPEWLDYCEDLVFDLCLRQRAASFTFVPDALVYFRPRGSLTALFRQYYRYARGDGKADLWRKRHAIRYATYLVAAPLILGLGFALHPLAWLLGVAGAAIYLAAPYRRLPIVLDHLEAISPGDRLAAAALVPLIRVVGDAAKMIGYPAGWRWRLRHQPPDWRQPSHPANR
ncbi:MAG: glycosyltransferase [Anaerolineae bacterium]|nr:glycosyltransferase [Anaerolineae bacterium]